MKLLSSITFVAVAAQAHFFGRSTPLDSVTLSLQTSTEIPIPTRILPAITIVETEVVPVTHTVTATSTAYKSYHIQPTVSVYELSQKESLHPIPPNVLLKKRVIIDVLLERNKTFADIVLHNGVLPKTMMTMIGMLYIAIIM